MVVLGIILGFSGFGAQGSGLGFWPEKGLNAIEAFAQRLFLQAGMQVSCVFAIVPAAKALVAGFV